MILRSSQSERCLRPDPKGRLQMHFKGLMRLAPKHAVVLRNGIEETVSIEQVKKGDVFLVRPGENIP